MKINIGSKELIDVLNIEDFKFLKEKLAGTVLETINSKEMEKAINKMCHDNITKALQAACYINKNYFSGINDISGWAADLIKKNYKQALESIKIDELIKEEVNRAINEHVKDLVLSEIDKYVNISIASKIDEFLDENNLESKIETLVQNEIKKSFKKLLL